MERNIPQELEPYVSLVYSLGKILGKDCEVLLHDLSTPECSIIASANAEVSGRGVGFPMTELGLKLMKDPACADLPGIYNYTGRTEDGRLLKCGVHFIRNSMGKIVGYLCINMDLSKIRAARAVLDEFFKIEEVPLGGEACVEYFPGEGGGTESLLNSLKSEYGQELGLLSNEERKAAVKRLEEQGFFLVRGAMERLALEMRRSKFTIYGYLRAIRKERKS